MSESLAFSATVLAPQEQDGSKVAPPHGEIVRIGFPVNTHLDGESAAGLIEQEIRPADARPVAVLLQLSNLSSVSRAARTVLSAIPSVAAWALLGQSPVDRVLAHFILGAEFTSGPARYFGSEIDALRWLKENIHVR
ncbi:hypothetical protein [Pseudarthrobacter sp. N5]|uniref:DUF7793 family protein n=1 Tax=Pseudarthrobacter sp. N5 TaxID=3418416 RepID=UPI003CE701EF